MSDFDALFAGFVTSLRNAISGNGQRIVQVALVLFGVAYLLYQIALILRSAYMDLTRK